VRKTDRMFYLGCGLAVLLTLNAAPRSAQAQEELKNCDRISLSFMRPDIGRPGNYDFVNNGRWLVGPFEKLGVRWNRLAFLWVSMDEFEGGFDPEQTYGKGGKLLDLWGIIAGDKTWRKSAYVFQDILQR